MNGPSENSEFCFPSPSMFPEASPRGTLRVSVKQNSLFHKGPVIKWLLLYLPTQMRFLIGGERVTRHWSKLSDALGRTKLSNALGQQYRELSTCT